MGFLLGGSLAALSQEQLKRLAREGALSRLNELRKEIAAIEQTFPDLRARRGGRPRKQASTAPQAAQAADAGHGEGRRAGRRGWSASQRKAAADRMRAYWAKRKSSRKK
jgi:hypothetical protein